MSSQRIEHWTLLHLLHINIMNVRFCNVKAKELALAFPITSMQLDRMRDECIDEARTIINQLRELRKGEKPHGI